MFNNNNTAAAATTYCASVVLTSKWDVLMYHLDHFLYCWLSHYNIRNKKDDISSFVVVVNVVSSYLVTHCCRLYSSPSMLFVISFPPNHFILLQLFSPFSLLALQHTKDTIKRCHAACIACHTCALVITFNYCILIHQQQHLSHYRRPLNSTLHSLSYSSHTLFELKSNLI
jgi:hypothetical protein